MITKLNPASIADGTITADKLTITKSDVGLGNVDNTADSTKSVLKATQDGSGNVISSTYATNSELKNKQATLVSGTNIKTVNGTSILGSGNIVAGVKPLVTFNSTSIAMDPNKYYRLTTAKTSLTITLNTPSDSTILNEYFIEFPCTSTMTLTVPSTVKWANASVPTFESGKTYQISIVNNLAVCANFS